MKLIIAAFLVAFAAAALRERNELRDSLSPVDLTPFKTGQEYRYRFDSQIASGIAEISEQKALTRLQCLASFNFNTDRMVTLRLENIRMGTANRMVSEPNRIQPMGLVEETKIESEQLRKLGLPLQFNYVDGLIERITFHPEDDVWSKNIKRSVLNLLQVNLKAKNLPEEQRDFESEEERRSDSLTRRMYTVPETTLEGECPTTYVVNKLDSRRATDVDFFNVTKTINFKECERLSDVYYGPQAEKRVTEETDDQQKLRRSTMLRHFIVGTTEKFAIKKSESISQYAFKTLNAETETPMVSIVVCELTCIEVKKSTHETLRMQPESREESLLYSTDFDRDIKRFYMYGDEEYPENTPFSKILDKVTLVKNVLRKVLNSMNNKDIGLEAESTVQLPRLVTLLRTCSVKDLKNIIDSVDTKGKEILLDALAIAATRNTMHVLAEKIMKREISTPKAIQSLKAISGVPAPSDKQVEILIRLCKSDVVKGSESLRQSCWLTVGSLMGEFCETTEQNNYIIHKKVNTEVCPRHVTDKFLQPLMEEFRRVDTRYEKILVLKALGNAGIEPMVPELEKVIYDEREDPIVRVQAIDSLRRLREEIPERIQRILMPIFKNQRESTEVRLQALALVMQTLPENSILDQIAFVLIRERSKNVKSFVYDIMKAYSKSPIVEEQKLAGHLKAVVKLAGIDEVEEEKMRSSRAHRFPIYSNQQEEGIFLNWESMFSSDNAFPKKISAGMDSFLNGIFDKSTLELNFMQEDLDRWYEKFVNKMSDSYEGSSSRRSASVRRGQQELRSIFNNLGIKARSEYSPREDRRTNAPFGVLSLRFRDTDYVVLPLEEQFMPEVVRKLVIESERPRARDLEQIWKLLSQPSRVNTAWNLYERVIKVPSSAGIPLRLIQSTPVLGYVESDIKFNQGRVQIKLQPSMAASYIKKIEAWCPVVNSGVENVMSVELNLPVEGEIYTEDSKAKIIVKPPTSDKRMIGFHSLPVTFTRKYERTGVHGEMEVKTIRNELLESRMINLEEVYGEEKFALPTHIKGHIHKPTQNSYVSLFDALLTSENLVHIEFKPSPESPQQLMLTLDAESFKESNSKLRPQFTRFYSKFNEEMEKHHKFSEIDNENDEEKLNKYLEKFEPRQIYEHQIRAELKSIGGRRPKSAELSLKASCDDKFGYCQTEMEIRRDPILEGENEEWKLKSKVQALLPEYSHDLEQHQTDKTKKYQKFVCSVDSKWGSREEQYVNVRINGEQAKTQEWLDTEETETKRDREFPEKTAFLNKYDISIDYQLESASKNFFSNWFGMYKAYNFWNTKTHVQDSKEKQLVTALVVIDPISRQHLNVTINTPTERVKIHTVEMPTKVSPFPLIRRPMPSIGSVNELLTSVVVKKETQKECIVDGNQVHTFDEVTFKAPITKCYTVLAKDCSSSSPRFAVLLKKTDGDKKMLKIAKDGEMFEIESDGDNFKYRLNEEDKKERDMEDYGFTTRDNMMTYVSNELTVRFNGRKVWVKIDQLYKNSQCGLCGHYDDQEEGEFRMNDNKMTSDLREFHRSYTLKDGRCDSDFDETLRSERFETIRSEEFFSSSSESDENDDEKPFQKTYIMEYGSSKICFSKKPVPTCADDSYAVEKKEMKVQFGCLDRSSSEARTLLRRLKKERVVEEIRDLANSFVEQIRVPIKCAEY